MIDDTIQIIKICFSIIIRNIFLGVVAIFKEIKSLFMNKFISLLIISSILQLYLLNVSSLPPFTFKVSAHHHFGLDPPLRASSMSSFVLGPPPPPNVMV